MIFSEIESFVTKYIETINECIQEYSKGSALTNTQKFWLSFCITGILITNSICWAKFERASIGQYSVSALSWIFKKSKIPWEKLLFFSTILILRTYNITKGCLGIDDTNKKRSKSTKRIAAVHKLKDKTSGGYIMGQCIVFLILITPKITFPVGFAFYVPDPELKAWKKADEQLRKQGVPAQNRPTKPPKNENYPTIPEISLELLKQFKTDYPNIKIQCIFADALYGTSIFIDQASQIFGGVQVISQIRSNQNIRHKNNEESVEEYFKKHPGVDQTIKVRGGSEIKVKICSARLHVCSHGKKRFVIALKYDGEEEYRYIIAYDVSWRTQDIAEAYTLRWFVEVFFEDWKQNEGWDRLTKQTGVDGTNRSLILSLLADHCLFFHPAQLNRIENNLPAYTVGSLVNKVKVECLLSIFRGIIESENPLERFKRLTKDVEENVIVLNPSSKHMVSRCFGNLAPSPSLKYKKAA